jgi:SAM-dependent methyltransferase
MSKTAMQGAPVYGSARGLLPKIAEPFAHRARERRHLRFRELCPIDATAKVLDVGCGNLGLRALATDLDVTGVDISPRPAYPGPFVQADATEHLPFEDNAFDLVYANSVIEHIAPQRREAFAAEVRRVGRGWYVQTPARSFPLEPHALLPGAHWLPRQLRRIYWRLGAAGHWEDISLLGREEMEHLFGPAQAERYLGLTKSWICVRSPG